MSEEHLSALLTKLKEDAGLKEKLTSAVDLDAAVALAKEAGFDVSKEDWLCYQEKQYVELSDFDLEYVAGGCQRKTASTAWNECKQITAAPCGPGGP